MEQIVEMVKTNVQAITTIISIVVTAIIQNKHLLKKLKDELKKK